MHTTSRRHPLESDAGDVDDHHALLDSGGEHSTGTSSRRPSDDGFEAVEVLQGHGPLLDDPMTLATEIVPSESLQLQLGQASTTGAVAEPPGFATGQGQSGVVSKERPVGWLDLPKKGQLAVLTLARLSEPLSERSLAAYIFYQLRSFDPSLPDSTITSQGGLLTAAFAGAQLFTAVWWGRAADSPRVGRKMVILIGLAGSAIATLGVGFSKNFPAAMACRILAGALNGNTGVMRTMISEMIEERKFQSRAFLLLPMCFNIGIIIGPIMGGFLADPIDTFPKVFGPGSAIGGSKGVAWMAKFPYALPNVFSGTIILFAALAIFLGLDETHMALRHRRDRGRVLGNFLTGLIFRKQHAYEYQRVQTEEVEMQSTSIEANDTMESETPSQVAKIHNGHQSVNETANQSKMDSGPKARLGVRSILSSNIVLTLLSHHLLALHVSTFNALVYLFLPAPQSHSNPTGFSLRFTGGLGLSTSQVGLATSIIGIIGLPLTILAYPPINTKLGTLRSYRTFLPFCAIAYSTIPFLALFANHAKALWPLLTAVWIAQVLGRTFSLPSTVILINNSSPSREVLGTIHGLAQSVSSAGRMFGPILGGWALGLGLTNNCVGAVWWAMAAVVIMNWSILWLIWEGDGRGGKATL